ncbi:MAG: hypothetical protein WC787_05010 [Patescibacteria group bacterium]|jgi:hypothetical protein
MQKTRHSFVFAAFLLTLAISFPLATHAEVELDPGFNPDAILSDNDIFDANAFPYDRMVRFLMTKGTLATAAQLDIDGQLKPVPQIIWRVSQTYKINPKYLIALIQKEQSLVEHSNPSQRQFDWAAGYGVCDSCAKDDPSIQDFKGFAAQLEWAAKQHREKYLMQLLTRGLTIGGQGLGKTVTIDGMKVTPANNATAMLYSYTPHIHGNLTLWRIWKRWFSVKFPEGTIVRAATSGKTYMLRFGEKRPFASKSVITTMVDPEKVVVVQDTDLANYPDGTPIKFPEYALLRDPEGRIFLLAGGMKRHIANQAAFQKFGFNSDEVEDVESADLVPYPDGTKITVETQFPQGLLMKIASAPGVWYVEDGKRQPLLDGSLLKLYFSGRRVKTVYDETLAAIATSTPYLLHDGELVKSNEAPTVYVVENAKLRPIPSGDIFESVGWKWHNVVTVPDRLIAAHELGEPLNPNGEHAELAATSL